MSKKIGTKLKLCVSDNESNRWKIDIHVSDQIDEKSSCELMFENALSIQRYRNKICFTIHFIEFFVSSFSLEFYSNLLGHSVYMNVSKFIIIASSFFVIDLGM